MNYPFLLSPASKDYLWGGNRLNEEFGKNIDVQPLAETWECSTHPDGLSIVGSGMDKGRFLSDVLENHPEYLGSHPLENSVDGKAELPILIKFIDANKNLSVQVHPDDEYAYKNENGQRGKAEMWYVLDATENASLVYGLQFELPHTEIKKRIADGSFERYLQKVPVKKDDVFFVEPGTIHAIGSGVLVAEIQENSNLTYRLYDYDRIDKNGNRRTLHIDKAIDVANFKAGVTPKQSMRVLRYRRGCATELLGRCKYFEVYRMIVNTDGSENEMEYQSDDKSFRALLCLTGKGSIFIDGKKWLDFEKGNCIFVPANSVELKLRGRAQMLDVRA